MLVHCSRYVDAGGTFKTSRLHLHRGYGLFPPSTHPATFLRSGPCKTGLTSTSGVSGHPECVTKCKANEACGFYSMDVQSAGVCYLFTAASGCPDTRASNGSLSAGVDYRLLTFRLSGRTGEDPAGHWFNSGTDWSLYPATNWGFATTIDFFNHFDGNVATESTPYPYMCISHVERIATTPPTVTATLGTTTTAAAATATPPATANPGTTVAIAATTPPAPAPSTQPRTDASTGSPAAVKPTADNTTSTLNGTSLTTPTPGITTAAAKKQTSDTGDTQDSGLLAAAVIGWVAAMSVCVLLLVRERQRSQRVARELRRESLSAAGFSNPAYETTEMSVSSNTPCSSAPQHFNFTSSPDTRTARVN